MPQALRPDEPSFNEKLSDQKLLDYCFECRTASRGFFDGRTKKGVLGPWREADYFHSVNASESLSEADLEVLRQTKRPNIDPPFAAGVLDAVIGAEIAQETEPVFQGVDKGFEDSVIADWLTQLLRNGFALAGAGEKMLEAFSDKLVSGYGFVQMYIDLHRIPFMIAMKKLPFWQVWPDPDAIEPNLKDAKFWILESEWDLEDAKANWSSVEQGAAIDRAKSSLGGARGILPKQPSGGATGKRRKKNGVLIIEFQYRRSVARARYADPETDEEVDSTREDYEKRKAEVNASADELLAEYDRQVEAADQEHEANRMAWEGLASSPDPVLAQGAGPEPAPPVPPPPPQPPRLDDAYEAQYVTFYNGYSYRRAFIAGESAEVGAILEDKEIDLPLPGDEPGFTIKADTGYGWQLRDEQRVRRYGLMRKIVHIQEWFTRFIGLYIELMGRKVKGGGIAEPAAFEGIPGGFEDFVKKTTAGGVWSLVADGSIAAQKIQPWGPVQGEPALQEAVSFMKELFGWVTGVSQALQGTMTADRSNVLTENLQKQGLQMLLPVRRPRQEFLLSCGRLYAAIALKHLPAEQLDRILGVQEIEGMTVQKQVDPMTGQPALGPDGKPVLVPIAGPDGEPVTAGKILKQVDLLDYDLQADIAQANQSEKMRFMQVWQQHGLGQILADSLPGAAGTKIWLPRLFKNLPMPASDAKAMASEAEALLEQQEKAETEQGIVAAMQQIQQSDPEAAAQLIAQLQQIVGGQEPAAQPAAA